MSLNLINHKLTTSTTDENGVIWWENPALDVKINSNGAVYLNNVVVKTMTKRNQYSCYVRGNGKKKQLCSSFNSLFARIVLGRPLGGKTITLKDKSKGYVVGNTEIISSNNRSANIGARTTQPELNTVTAVKQAQQKKSSLELPSLPPHAKLVDLVGSAGSLDVELKPQTKEQTMEQYYTLYEAKNEHTTEDGAVFPTKELAEWHQTNVSKGKGNAQVVLDYNGGFVLAEQIYFQEVVYNKAKPYLHFTDVLNNNKGVVSNVQEEHCKFDKLDNEHGFRSEICFMTLRKQLPEQVSKHQAQKIQGALERYSDSVKVLDESIVGLEALLKQVK